MYPSAMRAELARAHQADLLAAAARHRRMRPSDPDPAARPAGRRDRRATPVGRTWRPAVRSAHS